MSPPARRGQPRAGLPPLIEHDTALINAHGNPFGGYSARRDDPDTSAAAASGTPSTRKFRRGMALVAFGDIAAAGAYGRTCDELCAAHPTWDRGTAARRITDLADAGLVADSGRRRRTRRKCWAVAWVAVGDVTAVPAVEQDRPPLTAAELVEVVR